MKREDLLAPEMYNLVEEVERFAKDPEKVAIKWEDEQGNKAEITYENLVTRVNKIGNALLGAGLKKGDKAIIMVPRLIDAYAIYLGCLKVGITVSPGSEMLREKDIRYRLTHGEMKAVISVDSLVNEFNRIHDIEFERFVIGKSVEGWQDLHALEAEASDILEMADTKADDMAFLSYTSGTTGNP
ncbi:AMP-binding protein, partial [Schinkia azotoformans]